MLQNQTDNLIEFTLPTCQVTSMLRGAPGPMASLILHTSLSSHKHKKVIPNCCAAPAPPVPGVKMEPSNCLSHTERGAQVLNYRVRAMLAAE